MKAFYTSLVIALATLLSSTSYADVYVYQCSTLTLDLPLNDMNFDRDLFYELSGDLNGEYIEIFDDEFKIESSSYGPIITEIMGKRQVPALKCQYRQSFHGAGGVG